MYTPEISVIVPVYRSERYLEKCITSILNQTFSNFELILIDDGSPDNSGEICEKYRRLDKRVKVIHQQNEGISMARNKGLKISSGKYIVFCDSDDYVEVEWLERLHSTVVLNPDKWILCGLYIIQGDKENGISLEKHCSIEEYYLIYKAGLSAYCWNKIYQRNIIENNNLRFREDVLNGEDILFNIEYLQYAKGIVSIPDILYHYNLDNMNSVTNQYNAKHFEDSRFAYSVRKKVIDPAYEEEYSEIWYYRFWNDIYNVFDVRNKWNFFNKISYGSYILKSKEFRECHSKVNKSSVNKMYLKLVENGNYLWIFFYEKVRCLFK